MTNRVKQEHHYGCMIAVLAMIMGISYQDALNFFPEHPDKTKGYSFLTMDTILVDQGYWVARKWKRRGGFGYDRDIWPPKPFAKLHWCEVNLAHGTHAVIMLEDGSVLDPWSSNRTSLDHPDYVSVNFVAAVGSYQLKASTQF